MTQKPNKKAPAKKTAVKKASAKKAVAKKAPAKKTSPKAKTVVPQTDETVTNKTFLQDAKPTTFVDSERFLKSIAESNVIKANDIKSASLRKRMLAWFKIRK
jgi:hypothetical protein